MSIRKWQIAVCLVLFVCAPALAQPLNVDGYLKQARAFVDLRRYSEAEREYINANIQAEHLGPRNPTLISVLNEFANFYVSQGNFSKAEPLYRRQIDLQTSLSGSQCPEVAQGKKQLAEMYFLEGKYNEAESLLQESLQYWQDSVDRNGNNPRANSAKDRLAIADCCDDLAKIYRQIGRNDQAKEFELRSQNIRQNPTAIQ
jgi:tetratricopeptide (TPR) repeat protein